MDVLKQDELEEEYLQVLDPEDVKKWLHYISGPLKIRMVLTLKRVVIVNESSSLFSWDLSAQ